MHQINKAEKIITWMFFSTGIFAIIGALYTWGKGPLHLQDDLLTVLVPWADLLFTGPLSILAAYGILTRKGWGHITGLMTCGIYLFGSTLVYITLVWQGAPYPLHLALPPLVGIFFGIWYPIWVIRQGIYSFPPAVRRTMNQLTQADSRPFIPGLLQMEDPGLE